jgi:c-di-GMP-binding flagellar brake protein YcgR
MEGNSGTERRRYKRLPINLNLSVDELFKQDNIMINDVGASISVVDISKSGIGFLSTEGLPSGYYFKGLIDLGDGDFFRVVIQIVRSSVEEDGRFVYGAQFIGLAPFLADKVDKYDKKMKMQAEP